MSLITCCPACGTMFKVVPDQLRISEGWVRCGHCAEVFDASAHLQGDEAPALQPGSAQAPAPAARKEALAAAEGPDSEAFASSVHTEIPESEGLHADPPDSALLEAAAQALVEHPLDQPFELRREDPARADAIDQRNLPVRTAVPPEPEPALEDLAFVQQARRKEVWHRPAVRVALLLLLLALGALLTAQIALQDRDRLAAAKPELRPWLARLCEPLRCTIQPPRQIDAIAIDSSSFNKLRADSYRLNVTLKNQAAIEVAMPALELTLTDGQDQALIRRVVMPQELGPNAAVIPAASEWSGSLALAVADGDTSGRIAGYRLLAFYP